VRGDILRTLASSDDVRRWVFHMKIITTRAKASLWIWMFIALIAVIVIAVFVL
jgi:hypothetical protein